MQIEMSVVNEKIEVAQEYIASVTTQGYNDQLDNAHNIMLLAAMNDWQGIMTAPLEY